MTHIRDTSMAVLLLAATNACAALPADAQIPPSGAQTANSAIPYARVADLVVAAPLIIDATVRSTSALKAAESPGLIPGNVRLYIEADVVGLIRGTAGVPPRIAYLADVPLDSRGRVPRMKRLRVLVFAQMVPGRPREVQLVRPDAQLAWTPALDATVRAVTAEAVRPDAAPVITRVTNATHVRGNLVGEGETTIFLATERGDPVSLTVLRRPGQQPTWSVALGEVVTDSAGPARPDTLLWYRLACGLPEAVPESALTANTPEDAAIAQEDYAFISRSLGPCTR